MCTIKAAEDRMGQDRAGREGRHNPLNPRGRRHFTADPARTESLSLVLSRGDEGEGEVTGCRLGDGNAGDFGEAVFVDSG